MKKSISLLMVFVMALMLLTACGKPFAADSNTIYVQKKGKIIGAAVESFDKEYYNAEELQAYVEERVAAYTTEHGKKSIEVQEFSVEEGVAKLNMVYAGYEDYATFNEVEMFSGTVAQAMTAGYDFEDSFLKVEDGKLSGSANKDQATEDFEYKVVILNEKVNVKVDGTILYTSADYTSLIAEDTVSIALPENAQDGEELALTYIIYK